MAEKSSSRIRYDDIVSAVHADPANAEPMVVLSGYLGKSPEDGNLRIYPDASLGHWYEVAEGDVVHSRPLSDSALGGSNVWLKASAKITPGVATAPRPAEGEEGSEGDDAAAQALPDTGVFNPLATIHPTLWTQIGCHTQLPGCGTGTIHPTIWTQIGCSTQAGCIETISCLPPGLGAQAYAARPHTAGVGCPDTISCTPHHISLPGCVHTGGVGCPDTISCPPGAALAATVGGCPPRPTIYFYCTIIGCQADALATQHGCPHISVPGCLPPHTLGCPVLSVPGCLPPRTIGCPVLSVPGCLPPHTLGCPVLSVPGCLPPPTLGCPILSVPGCLPPPTLGCPQPTLGCPQAIGNTAATVCTQYGCPHPGNTTATVCTQFGCPQPGGEAHAAQAAQVGSSVFGCSMICSVFVTCSPLCAREAAPAQAYPVSVPGHCPTVGPQCQLLSAPPHCPTVAPPCGMLSAPPHCPTVAPPCGMLSAPPFCPTVGPPCQLLSAPPFCPTVGACPPTNMPGCPSSHAGCPPTHMLGCPPTQTCPPTHMYGCPSSHAGCPPQGGYATFPFCP